MNYYIVTGASKGLGLGIVNNLIDPKNNIICISRNKNETIIKRAKSEGCQLNYFEYDLNHVEGIDDLIDKIFSIIDTNKVKSITLINNAGVVTPIKPIGKTDSNAMIKSIHINTIAPMILASQFITHTKDFNCTRKICNISSGAGSNPYYGWGTYCTSKAAMDMFGRCVGVEQEKENNPVKIISFSPGIIDTPMQEIIRESNEDDFELIHKFRKFKEDGALRSPDFVAKKVIEAINKKDLDNGSLIHIMDLI
ncbi:benzil reductase ((S)-benzoin forming) [Natranaerovirga hydrolytica]|uniref:Benzil reductase ((S)-benzoin forming) n=1 Tax=Natranaerovirga hydrolytica TaxID=680378 RepID=A0A4R1MY13_9FIRM|nr:(S)-benzoin forming benzil reductase [Natranaerovirga hydrolytica]TCK98168.1 benzil reductase ((S)-benzoin forming) [Natranaerovirga hydrolytica]